MQFQNCFHLIVNDCSSSPCLAKICDANSSSWSHFHFIHIYSPTLPKKSMGRQAIDSFDNQDILNDFINDIINVFFKIECWKNGLILILPYSPNKPHKCLDYLKSGGVYIPTCVHKGAIQKLRRPHLALFWSPTPLE